MTADSCSQRRVVLPIRVGIDMMERLLVATFKGDPDFEGFEPQVFDDPVNGKGMRVLRYRKDGKVDVYWQPGVRVDRSTFTVGVGIGDFAETTIEPTQFKITERGVDLHVAFTDAQGRKVELHVLEDAPGKHGVIHTRSAHVSYLACHLPMARHSRTRRDAGHVRGVGAQKR